MKKVSLLGICFLLYMQAYAADRHIKPWSTEDIKNLLAKLRIKELLSHLPYKAVREIKSYVFNMNSLDHAVANRLMQTNKEWYNSINNHRQHKVSTFNTQYSVQRFFIPTRKETAGSSATKGNGKPAFGYDEKAPLLEIFTKSGRSIFIIPSTVIFDCSGNYAAGYPVDLLDSSFFDESSHYATRDYCDKNSFHSLYNDGHRINNIFYTNPEFSRNPWGPFRYIFSYPACIVTDVEWRPLDPDNGTDNQRIIVESITDRRRTISIFLSVAYEDYKLKKLLKDVYYGHCKTYTIHSWCNATSKKAFAWGSACSIKAADTSISLESVGVPIGFFRDDPFPDSSSEGDTVADEDCDQKDHVTCTFFNNGTCTISICSERFTWRGDHNDFLKHQPTISLIKAEDGRYVQGKRERKVRTTSHPGCPSQ